MKINWCVENLENNLKSTVAVQNDGTVRGGFLVVGKDDFIIKEAAGSYSEQVHDYVENGNEEVTSFNNDFAELIGIEGYILFQTFFSSAFLHYYRQKPMYIKKEVIKQGRTIIYTGIF